MRTKLTRRSILQGALLVATAASAHAGGALVTDSTTLFVYDSREAQSLALRERLGLPAIDVAQQHAERWSALRALQPEGRIAGLTKWSDHVLVRTLLEEKGLRLRSEARRGALFYWDMS